MRNKRRCFIIHVILALVLLMPAVLVPRPVLAAQMNVTTAKELQDAVNKAKAGDVVNVTEDIDLVEDELLVEHKNPFTITSSNKSVISAEGYGLLFLEPDAEVTLTGNLSLQAKVKDQAIRLDYASLTVKDQVKIKTVNASMGIAGTGSRVIMSGGTLDVEGTIPDKVVLGIGADQNTTVNMDGGTILVRDQFKATGFKLSKGISLSRKSNLYFSKGMIDVKGQGACGIHAENGSSILMTGSKVRLWAAGETSYTSGVWLDGGSRLQMHAGLISVSNKSGLATGIMVDNGSELEVVYQTFADLVTIESPAEGIVVSGKDSLMDLAVTDLLHLDSVIRFGTKDILRELPAPPYLTAGRSYKLSLQRVNPAVTFSVDPQTSSKLNFVEELPNNQYLITSLHVGSFPLVLTMKTSPPFARDSTFRLRIALTVIPCPFKDVNPSDWPLDYIMFLYREGVIKGYPDGNFRPANNIRRDHVAKMVAIGADLNWQGKKANFPDVDPDGEMSPYIAALVEAGAIGGFPDGTFRPKQTIERGHAAKIVAKAFNLKMGELPSDFPDLPPDPDGQAVKILASNGIVKGYKDGTFRPKQKITRAEFSKILTLAKAVYRVQVARDMKDYWIPGFARRAVKEAQMLINSLPHDQDEKTKSYLQSQLDKIKSEMWKYSEDW